MNQTLTQFLKLELFPFFKDCFKNQSDRYWLTGIVLLNASICVYFIDQPMRVDESWTFLASVKDGWTSVFTYVVPNNHVLHSIFVKLSTSIFGAHPWSIRLPALLFGVLSIVLVFCASRCFGARGLFAAAVVATNPYMILFSTNARGYSLLLCFFLALIVVGRIYARSPSKGGATAVAILSALGVFTIPTMVFPLSGMLLWIAYVGLRSTSDWRLDFIKSYVCCGLKMMLLIVLLYAPVIYLSGLKPIIANDWVIPQPFGEFLKGIRWHFEGTFFHFIRDVPIFFLVVCFVSVVHGFYVSAKEKENWLISFFCTLVLGGGIVFFTQHSIPFERTWIYFIPVFAMIADKGVTDFFERYTGRAVNFLAVLLCLSVMTIPIRLVLNESISKYNDTGIFVDSAEVAKTLATTMKTGDAILTTDPEYSTLFFHLWYFNAPNYKYGEHDEVGRTYYVVPPSRSVDQLTKRPVKEWKTINETKIYK
jgi:4-amino-4-deoxy-L-arabinose transferase-like glycosyltransferase